jgi:hypothetical protein
MDSPTEQEIATFVGKESDTYLRKWREALDDNTKSKGFNWAAFFFAGFWLAYRKMYKVAIILLSIIIAESILEDIIFVGILDYIETPAMLDRIIAITVAAICGVQGNKWYLTHTLRNISAIKNQGLPEAEYSAALSKTGGTNLLAAFGMLILFIAIMFGAYYFLDIAFGIE